MYKRPIIYNKKNEPTPHRPPPSVPESRDRSQQIKDWLTDHPLFKIAGMCRELGIDKSNFNRTLKSEKTPIPEKHLDAIEQLLKNYGYN